MNAKRATVLVLAGLAVAAAPSALSAPRDRATGVVAYTAGGEVRSARSDGSEARTIARGDSPSWSPDGRELVFDSARNGPDLDLWITYADGSNQRRLATHPGGDDPADASDDFDPAWAPNDDMIAFVSSRTGDDDIWLTNSIGHMTSNFTRASSSDRSPAWSPDGKSLAFVSDRMGNDDVYTEGRDGLGLRRITNTAAAEDSPVWSPDGRKLAFQSFRDGNWEIYTASVDSGSPQRITDDPAADTNPSWSPDGTLIAFTSDRGNSHTRALYVVDASGGVARSLASGAAGDNTDWQPSVDVALDMSAPRAAALGASIRVGVRVTSARPLPALRTALTLRVAAGAQVIRARSSRGSCTRTRAIRCALGTIEPTTPATVVLSVRPQRCAPFVVRASVTGQRVDVEPANNQRRQPIRVTCR